MNALRFVQNHYQVFHTGFIPHYMSKNSYFPSTGSSLPQSTPETTEQTTTDSNTRTPITLPQSTMIAIGVSVSILFVLVILFVMALFLVWHCARKNKQAGITEQPATQDGQEDIQMGDNTAYRNRLENGQDQFELNNNEAYEQRRDETGRSNEPYYSTIRDNGTQITES